MKSKIAAIDMSFLAAVKAIAEKYRTTMYLSLQAQTDIDARQSVYYCAYGATLAQFETLVAVLAAVPDQTAKKGIHSTAQEILALCSQIEQQRKAEAVAFEQAVASKAGVH